MKVAIEIRSGEGGEDAKLLVADQGAIYIRYADRNGLRVEVTDQGHG